MAILLSYYGLTPEGVLKTNEITPGVYEHSSEKAGLANGHSSTGSPNSFLSSIPGVSFLAGGFELVAAIRGIGWKFGSGTGLYVPPDRRDRSNKGAFIAKSLVYFTYHMVLADLMQSSIRMLFPDIWDLNTSIFGRGSNFLESAAISTAIHCASGLFIVFRTSPSYDSSSHSNSRKFDVLYQILWPLVNSLPSFRSPFSIATLNHGLPYSTSRG